MSRSSASFRLPREPDFLQHVPAIHGPDQASVLKIQTNTIQSQTQPNAKPRRKTARTSSSPLCGSPESRRQTLRDRSAPWSRSDPSATPSRSRSNSDKPVTLRTKSSLRTPATAPKPFLHCFRNGTTSEAIVLCLWPSLTCLRNQCSSASATLTSLSHSHNAAMITIMWITQRNYLALKLQWWGYFFLRPKWKRRTARIKKKEKLHTLSLRRRV